MIKYIILLRGINISGKNKIAMEELKKELEKEYTNVSTYLNSGNVILESNIQDKDRIKENIEKMIKRCFFLDVPVFIMQKEELEELLDNKPEWWGSDNKEIYDTIIFIIPPMTFKEVCSVLGEPKEGLERIQTYKNSIFWSYHLKDYRKTNWWSKTASTSISNSITIRTANTMKKILQICNK